MQVEYFHYAQTHLDFLTLQLVLHQGGSNGKASVYIVGDPASIPFPSKSSAALAHLPESAIWLLCCL